MDLKGFFVQDSRSKTELDRLRLLLRDSRSENQLDIVKDVLTLGDSNRRIQNKCLQICTSYLQGLKSKENRDEQVQVFRLIAEKFKDGRKPWRNVTLDFSKVVLHSDLIFSELTFSGCEFVFEGSSLYSVNIDFSKSSFEGCNFIFRSTKLKDVGVSFEKATLKSKKVWQDCLIDFGESCLQRSNICLADARVRNVCLSVRGCHLVNSAIDFEGTHFEECDLDFSLSELSQSEVFFQATNCASTNAVLAGVTAVESVFNASGSQMSESYLVFGESTWSKSTIIVTGQALTNSTVSLRKIRQED